MQSHSSLNPMPASLTASRVVPAAHHLVERARSAVPAPVARLLIQRRVAERVF